MGIPKSTQRSPKPHDRNPKKHRKYQTIQNDNQNNTKKKQKNIGNSKKSKKKPNFQTKCPWPQSIWAESFVFFCFFWFFLIKIGFLTKNKCFP